MGILGLDFADALLARISALVKAENAPNAADLAQLVDTAFWASVRREEGRDVRFSVSFFRVPRHRTEPYVFPFTQRRTFTSANVARLAPALDPVAEAIMVDSTPAGLSIWGTGDRTGVVTVSAVAPATIILRAGGENVWVSDKGTQLSLASRRADFQRLLAELVGEPFNEDKERPPSTKRWLLSVVIRAMRAHRNGGTLVLVPTGDSSWKSQATLHYQSDTPSTTLSGWAAEEFLARGAVLMAEAAATSIGRLTGVDGAVILNRDFELFGFGAVLDATGDPTKIPVSVHPTGEATRVGVGVEGGTRHQSAATFCFANPESVGFVASHDGPLTIFYRAPGAETLSVFLNANYHID